MQGVDTRGQKDLYELITELRSERKCSVLMISHDLHLVMASTDHVLCINQHVCCSGHPRQVQQHPEYLKLFDRETVGLAVYTHQHDVNGDIGKELSSVSRTSPHKASNPRKGKN